MTNRQPRGVPVGGQFAATVRSGAQTTLPGVDEVREELLADLDGFGPIPDPQPGQRLVEPFGDEQPQATFAETYVEYFRPVVEHNDVAADIPGLSREQMVLELAGKAPATGHPSRPLNEQMLLDLAGVDGDLGRYRGVSLERDEDTGEPVVVVSTRNGGGNREHVGDGEEGPGCGCTGCVQTYRIPQMPTYLRDADDEDEKSYADNYFRTKDEDAARTALALIVAQEVAARRTLREAIRSGQKPPWEILTPADHYDSRAHNDVRRRWLSARGGDSKNKAQAQALQERIDQVTKGEPIEGARLFVEIRYNAATNALARAQERRKAAVDAASELGRAEGATDGLPDVIAELVAARKAELRAAAEDAKQAIEDNSAEVDAHRSVLLDKYRQTSLTIERAAEKEQSLERSLEDYAWKRSWPGERGQCPPRPQP